MPIARHHGTEQDREIYAKKLSEKGCCKYDIPATVNSIQQFDKIDGIKRRLLEKLNKKKEKLRVQQVSE